MHLENKATGVAPCRRVYRPFGQRVGASEPPSYKDCDDVRALHAELSSFYGRPSRTSLQTTRLMKFGVVKCLQSQSDHISLSLSLSRRRHFYVGRLQFPQLVMCTYLKKADPPTRNSLQTRFHLLIRHDLTSATDQLRYHSGLRVIGNQPAARKKMTQPDEHHLT